jgi:hypothetical protein
VEPLAHGLQTQSIEVSWSKDGLINMGPARWKRAIEWIIDAGGCFVACFSDSYWAEAQGAYINIEFATALERLRYLPPDRRWFVPVRLTDCRIPAFTISPAGVPERSLADLTWIDLWADWGAGVQRVGASIRHQDSIPDAVQTGLMRLSSPDLVTRRSAATTLGQVGSDAAVPALAEALTDEDPDVRWRAAEALGQIRSDAAVPALAAALHDPHAYVRWRAAASLGFVRSNAAVPALAGALGDDDARVREYAVWALGRVGNGTAIPVLGAALGHEDANVRARAARSLGDLRSEAAVDPLGEALADANPHVRAQAAEALGMTGSHAAAPALSMALRDDDGQVRRAAAQALDDLRRAG